MKKRSDANSLLAGAGLVFPSEAISLGAIIRKGQTAIQKLLQVDCLTDRLLCNCRLSRLQEIPPANLSGRDAHGRSDAIHVPLHRKYALRRAESSKRPVGRRIRGNRLRTDPHMRPIIWTT